MTTPSLSVVIPTLNAEDEIDSLLDTIEAQSLKPSDILVVDSSSDDGTVDEVAKHPCVNLVRIERKEFNHGSTRDMALRRSAGEFVCFLFPGIILIFIFVLLISPEKQSSSRKLMDLLRFISCRLKVMFRMII